ncbi:MAG: LysR substrate-binding domain-containing protein [Acidimicrobiales bacterium]
MTFTQLRTFVELAATGSVHDAARRLVVSPPSVSAAVAALSAEIGVKLVVRSGRGIMLTPAGEVFAGYARRILGLAEEAAGATAAVLDPERGRVRLAAVTTAGEHVLPRLLASFRRRRRATEVSLEVGNRARVWEALTKREVDLAIGGRPPAGGALRTLATRANVLVLVACGNGRPEVVDVGVEQLADRVLLLREPGSGTRRTAEEIFEEMGVSPATLTLGSNGAIRESVQVGLGITVIARDAVARELDEGSLVEWRCGPLPEQRAWHLVARSGEDLHATAALFLDHAVTAGVDGFTLGNDA